MGGKQGAEYYREWRRKHPEYRERERERHRRRTPEQRRAERERAKQRAAEKAEQAAKQRARTDAWRAREPEKYRESYLRHNRKSQHRYYYNNQFAKRRREGERWLRDAERIVAVVIRRDERDDVFDPLYEDALSECILVLIARRKANTDAREQRALEHVQQFVHEERTRRWYEPLNAEAAAAQGWL